MLESSVLMLGAVLLPALSVPFYVICDGDDRETLRDAEGPLRDVLFAVTALVLLVGALTGGERPATCAVALLGTCVLTNRTLPGNVGPLGALATTVPGVLTLCLHVAFSLSDGVEDAVALATSVAAYALSLHLTWRRPGAEMAVGTA